MGQRRVRRGGPPPHLVATSLKGVPGYGDRWKPVWDGGTVRYRMANQRHQRELPALLGKLQTTEGIPSITIRYEMEDTPLLQARLDNDGWVHVGITKRFTQLVGQPWRGNESDAAIVMEVSEKLL